MIVCRTAADLAAARAKAAGPVALVPTMGALHAGHVSLLRIAREVAGSVWATIFVNAVQFNRDDDFARYPRDEAGDFAQLEACGIDVVYAPSAEEVWAGQKPVSVIAAETGLAQIYEGTFRPGHLEGVEAVVERLFDQTQPDCAVFGEKDYQQLLLIRAIAERRNDAIRIIAAPVVREDDDLACSSRNQLLDAAAREQATALPVALAQLAAGVRGQPADACPEYVSIAETYLKEAGLAVDYVAVAHADDLTTVGDATDARVVLGAVHAGSVRLIDVWPV